MGDMNKRGQMFLLAGIIISVILIGFTSTQNYARVKPELKSFEELAREIKYETAQVTNYQAYNNIQDITILENFIDNVSIDLREKDPYADFMFIYGNTSTLYLRNYGSSLATAIANNCNPNQNNCGTSLQGAGETFQSTINLGGTSSKINFNYEDTQNLWKSSLSGLGNGAEININIKGNNFTFPIGNGQTVIFLNIKEIEDEQFVATE